MKNKLLMLSLIAIFGILPVSATLSVSESTKTEYLINQGYSATAVDMVNASKARANGEDYATQPERDDAKYRRWWPVYWFRRLVIYLDPALEAPDSLQHDIKANPSINDL